MGARRAGDQENKNCERDCCCSHSCTGEAPGPRSRLSYRALRERSSVTDSPHPVAVVAGLLLRSFAAVLAVDPGFTTTELLTMRIEPPMTSNPAGMTREQFTEALQNERQRTLAAAVALAGLLESLLFQIEPADPLTLAAVAALMLSIAGAAAYVPARRATRISPAKALQTE